MKQIKKLSFYEVNPRYFKDYSGNGTGDLIGLTNKFEYFNHINVDAIILQEILSTESPKEKNKSFTSVDSEIGDINGVIKIISLAKASKKKILIELNIGSVAENHNWFKSSQEQSLLDYKEVIDFKPKKIHEGIKYKYSSENKKYYAIDSNTQEVQINWGSEQVIDNFIKVIRFWIDLGVSGFVFKNFEYAAEEEQKEAMSKKTLKELRKLYRSIKEINDNVLVVGKSTFLPLDSSSSFTDGATKVFDYFWSTEFSKLGLHHKFKQDAIGKFRPRALVKKLQKYACNPANILAFNSSQFGKVLSRWLNDMQFIGESAKTLASLLIFNKASSLIYFGDEIGMPNIGLTHLDNFQDRTIEKRKSIAMQANLSEKDFLSAQVSQGKINARALMSWSDNKNGGFSISEKTITPVSSRYKEINVVNQFKSKYSVLNFYIELIRLAHSSSYSSIFKNGFQKISSPMFGVVKNKVIFDSKEIIVLANLTNGKKSLFFRPKSGKVILSSYSIRDYKEIPKSLDAYETVIIFKRTDEYIKETQMIKLESLKAKEAAKKEEQYAKEAEKKARISQVKKEEKTRLINLKIKEKEIEKARLIKIKEEEKKAAQKVKEQEERERKKQQALETKRKEEKKAAQKAQEKLEKEAKQEQEIEEAIYKNKNVKASNNLSGFQEEQIFESEINNNDIERENMKQEVPNNDSELEDDNIFDFDENLNNTSLKDEFNETKIKNIVNEPKSEIDIAKENAKIQKDVEDSYKDEATKLKEEEIAKTTLVDDSFDIDELFGEETKEKDK